MTPDPETDPSQSTASSSERTDGSALPMARALRYLIVASRPVGWIASVGLYRIGLAYGEVRDTPATWAVSAALSWPFCLYLFGLNDLADAESDRLNPRKGSWLHGASGPFADAAWVRAAPWLGGVAVLVTAATLPWRGAAILAAILALAWMYSTRPFRLKEVPVVDGLVTAAIMIGLLGAGYASGSTVGEIPVESWAVAPTLAGLHIYASVVDVASDRQAGHKTLAVRVGPRLATLVALGLSAASAATVPLLEYAPAIEAYVLFQPVVLAAALAIPKQVTGRRALAAVGIAGVATLLYLVFVYLR